MKVLVVGGGGREHALAWALGRSPRIGLLRCAPGNAGSRRQAEPVGIASTDVEELAAHARREAYDLVVIGPETPLVGGLADRLRDHGLAVFGPDAAAAEIEGSKVFAKEFMVRHGIPTAPFQTFGEGSAARRYLQSAQARYPLVVKADGLASGKGVLFAEGPEQAIHAAERLLGPAGSRIVVEDRLAGHEVSFFALADGERFVDLASCQDYKRVGDGDRGPNTGGMGAYSPSAHLDEPTRRSIVDSVVRPALRGLAAEGRTFRGVLYAGVMLTAEGPRVLEFNARFGDPEAQVLIPRLEEDWLPLLHDCATGRLTERPLAFRDEAAVCVVMASRGYPEEHDTAKLITGLADAEALGDILVFHAGTASDPEGRLVTAGGRVLGVTALGADVAAARAHAYAAVSRIRWEGAHHRRDIAADALEGAAAARRRA